MDIKTNPNRAPVDTLFTFPSVYTLGPSYDQSCTNTDALFSSRTFRCGEGKIPTGAQPRIVLLGSFWVSRFVSFFWYGMYMPLLATLCSSAVWCCLSCHKEQKVSLLHKGQDPYRCVGSSAVLVFCILSLESICAVWCCVMMCFYVECEASDSLFR